MKTSTANHSCAFSEEEVDKLRNVAFPKMNEMHFSMKKNIQFQYILCNIHVQRLF